MSLLEIRNFHCALDGSPVLRNVNLSIAPGESLGLVGESGSGKSLTALAIMRLLPDHAQCSGEIRFDGENIAHADDHRMVKLRGSQIGMIFQEPMTALNPLQMVGEQIAELFTIHQSATRSDALDQARSLMDRVGLSEIPATRYPHELSGGQRQRIVIAMAVACNPRLIIADEPTSALDVTTQAQILKLLKDVSRENGAALLFISHDLAVVAEVTDRIAVMQQGRIVEIGATPDFFGAMHDPYAKKLFAAAVHNRHRQSATDDGAPILNARHLTRVYRKPGLWRGRDQAIAAVKDVSITIRRGESLGLVGESGSGKSTLARALLGLDPLKKGTISLDGAMLDLTQRADRNRLRRTMQLVFQDPFSSFDPRRTIGWSLAEPCALLPVMTDAEQRERVHALLEQVGLPTSFAGRYPHEMSGGQRQRAAIARALMIDPAILVLDEPVSALDVVMRAQILDLLADLQEARGVALLFITHDLSLLRAITDRAIVMHNGVIVEEGDTETLLNTPRDPYTRALIAAAPRLDRFIPKRGP